LVAMLDAKVAYSDADFVVIAAPTNVYSTKSVAVLWSMVELNIHTKHLTLHEYAPYFTLKIMLCAVGH